MGKGLRDRSRALPVLLLRRADELLHQWGALQDRANDWQRELTRVQSDRSAPEVIEHVRKQLSGAEGDVSRLWDTAVEENVDMSKMVDSWIELQQRGPNPLRWDRKFDIDSRSLLQLQISALRKSLLTSDAGDRLAVAPEGPSDGDGVAPVDASTVSDSSATRVNEHDPSCPRGHRLHRRRAGGNFCNYCGQSEIWSPDYVFRCEGCDYDLCRGCSERVPFPLQAADGSRGGSGGDPPLGVAPPATGHWQDLVPRLVEDFFQMYTLTAMESRVARGLRARENLAARRAEQEVLVVSGLKRIMSLGATRSEAEALPPDHTPASQRDIWKNFCLLANIELWTQARGSAVLRREVSSVELDAVDSGLTHPVGTGVGGDREILFAAADRLGIPRGELGETTDNLSLAAGWLTDEAHRPGSEQAT